MGLSLTEKDIHGDKEQLGWKLTQLAEILVRKHYYASAERYKEDLVSVGVLKAFTMINSGKWDPERGSNFATWIYTGMRNDMSNFLYHEGKGVTIDIDEMVEEGKEDDYFNGNGEVYMSYSLIHATCLHFIPAFGYNIEQLVIRELEEIGYVIEGRKESSNSPTFVYYSDLVQDEYGKGAEEEIISRLVGLILWRYKEYIEEVDG